MKEFFFSYPAILETILFNTCYYIRDLNSILRIMRVQLFAVDLVKLVFLLLTFENAYELLMILIQKYQYVFLSFVSLLLKSISLITAFIKLITVNCKLTKNILKKTARVNLNP